MNYPFTVLEGLIQIRKSPRSIISDRIKESIMLSWCTPLNKSCSPKHNFRLQHKLSFRKRRPYLVSITGYCLLVRLVRWDHTKPRVKSISLDTSIFKQCKPPTISTACLLSDAEFEGPVFFRLNTQYQIFLGSFTVSSVAQEIPSLCGIRRFVTVFVKVGHYTLPWIS